MEAGELTENPSVRKFKALKSPNTPLSPPLSGSPQSLGGSVTSTYTLQLNVSRCRDLDLCVLVEALTTCAPGMYLLCGEKPFAFISRNVCMCPKPPT